MKFQNGDDDVEGGRHTVTRTFHFAIPARRLLRDRSDVQPIWEGPPRWIRFNVATNFANACCICIAPRRDRQRSRSKVITLGYVLTIATHRHGGDAVVSADRGEKGEEKDWDRPAGRLAYRDRAGLAGKSRREGGLVHCQYPTIEFTNDQPAGRHDRSAMLFPNSNSSSRVSSPRERWTTTSQRLQAPLCHPVLSYLVFRLKKKIASSRRNKQVLIRSRDTRRTAESISRMSYGGSFKPLREYRWRSLGLEWMNFRLRHKLMSAAAGGLFKGDRTAFKALVAATRVLGMFLFEAIVNPWTWSR